MRERVEFRLGMPSVNSWNGRWSGADRNFTIVKRLNASDMERLGIAAGRPRRWTHSFGDGWVASVTARVMDQGERASKSDGFYGYDWMVHNIIRWGTPTCQCEWTPDPNSGSPGYEGQWQRCRYCGTSQQVMATAESEADNA